MFAWHAAGAMGAPKFHKGTARTVERRASMHARIGRWLAPGARCLCMGLEALRYLLLRCMQDVVVHCMLLQCMPGLLEYKESLYARPLHSAFQAIKSMCCWPVPAPLMHVGLVRWQRRAVLGRALLSCCPGAAAGGATRNSCSYPVHRAKSNEQLGIAKVLSYEGDTVTHLDTETSTCSGRTRVHGQTRNECMHREPDLPQRGLPAHTLSAPPLLSSRNRHPVRVPCCTRIADMGPTGLQCMLGLT